VQRDLVEAARLGDHGAFEALASAAADRLYGFARLVLNDTHQADDAVQDEWVPFDPTGGGVAQLQALPSGQPSSGG